jgi:hypothetical protein
MKRLWIIVLVLIACAGAFTFHSQANNSFVKGDYVEVRTASVFAGACHFNGEYGTTGRDAMMAWKISSGAWNGTDLTGLRAVAVVTADDNLSNTSARRKSEIFLDEQASHEQRAALLTALKSRYATSLGEIVSVRTAPISFTHAGKTFEVSSPEAGINVEAMPNDLCCRQPNLVWYDPLIQVGQRKVGYTLRAFYSGHEVADPWQRADENSAFYGSFSF